MEQRLVISAVWLLQFQHDANGQRFNKVLNQNNTFTYYYYSEGRLTAEERRINNVNNTIKYLYNALGICGFTLVNPSNNSVYYFIKNIFGDVTHICNHLGVIVGKYDYDAYGNSTITLDTYGIATFNAIRYRSYYYDSETKLYYLNSRYYDPYTGRFISPDSYEYLEPTAHAGLNLYAYALNNPVMYSDPSGHFIIFAGIAAYIGYSLAGLFALTGVAYIETQFHPIEKIN